MTLPKKALLGAALALIAMRAAGAERSVTVDFIPNFVGAAAGTTTEWIGSKDRIAGVAPAGRVQFSGQRFVELYGPTVDVNLLDSPNWEFGPLLSYRFGRKDVKDPVVNLLPSIDDGWEAGAFVGWHYTQTEGIPWHLRLGLVVDAAISGGASGGDVSPFASFWFPLSHTVFVGVGAGFTWSSASFMQQRFGVDPAAANASGLPAYTAGAGVRQFFAWPSIVIQLEEHWFAGAGGFYQRLTGDAAGSPIVTQRGDRNQWTVGAGIGYAWK